MSLLTNPGPIPLEGKFTQKRMKLLKNIYAFYSAQQMMVGTKPTFDRIGEKKGLMNMPEFLKLLNDFKVLQDPQAEDQMYA